MPEIMGSQPEDRREPPRKAERDKDGEVHCALCGKVILVDPLPGERGNPPLCFWCAYVEPQG